MDQPPAVAFTAFADAWPRAIEPEIGAALCAIGCGKGLDITAGFVFLSDRIDEEYNAAALLKSLAEVKEKSIRKHGVYAVYSAFKLCQNTVPALVYDRIRW